MAEVSVTFSRSQEPAPMTRDAFARALQAELSRRAVPFRPADLATFVKDLWPSIPARPDMTRWADLYAKVSRGDAGQDNP